MKKKSKILVIVALSLFVDGLANAQVKLSANFGLQSLLENYVYDKNYVYDMGFGGNIIGEYMVTKNIGAGLGFGFYSFGVNEPCRFCDYSILPPEKGFRKSITIMPITTSGSYYFRTEGFKPYAGVELGAYVMRVSYEYGYDAETETHFGFAPVVGAQYDLSEFFGLNANLKCNYILRENDVTGFLGINIGIVYTFGK